MANYRDFNVLILHYLKACSNWMRQIRGVRSGAGLKSVSFNRLSNQNVLMLKVAQICNRKI